MPRVLNIAHRGVAGGAPENTFEAFDLALDQGADHLEFDVRVTGDGHHVLCHGPLLVGPGGRAPVAGTDLRRLLEIEPKIAELSDTVTRYGDRAGLFIELKDVGGGDRSPVELIELLDTLGWPRARADGHRDRVLSFDPSLVERLHRDVPELPLVQSFHWHYKPSEANLVRASASAVGICVWRVLCSKEVIARARALGLEVYVFTVDRGRTMSRYIALALDGIITNRPGRLRQLLRTSEP